MSVAESSRATFYSKHSRTIRIGGLYILSGPLSSYGRHGAWGTQLAIEELNKSGGLLGRSVDLLLADTRADPEQATHAARELVEKEHVDFLIGITNSEVALAVSELALETETLLTVVDAGIHRLTGSRRHPYVFRTITNTLMEGRAHARIFADQPWQRWFLFGPDYEFGYAFSNAFWEELTRLRPDIEMVGHAYVPLGTTDFSHVIDQIRDSQAEAVYNSLWGQDTVGFIQQALQQGLLGDVQHVCARGPLQMYLSLQERMPEGLWIGTPYFFTYPPTRRNHTFVREYQERWGDPPDYIGHEAHAGVQFLQRAIERAGSTKAAHVIEAAEGLQFESPKGTKFVQPNTHQVVEDIIVGRSFSGHHSPFPVLSDIVISPAEENHISLEETEHFLEEVGGF